MHPLAKLALIQLEGPRFSKSEEIPKSAFLVDRSSSAWDFYWSPRCRYIHSHDGVKIQLEEPNSSTVVYRFSEVREFVRELKECIHLRN